MDDKSINDALLNTEFHEEPKTKTEKRDILLSAADAIFGTNLKKNLGDLTFNQQKYDEAKEVFMHKIFQESGLGSFSHDNLDLFRGHDKFHTATGDVDSLRKGFTFFTKPRMCLVDANISRVEELHSLWVNDPTDMRYGIRCMLDSKFGRYAPSGYSSHSLVDPRNPFNTLLGNCTIGLSGFTDQVGETKNTPTGFAGEDQVYLWGHDYLNKSHDLTINVRDKQGGPLKAWVQAYNIFNFLAADGKVSIYPEDAEQFRMFYTFSIYRFVTDASYRYIEHYAKATGCFIHVINSGEWFNFSESSDHLATAGEFSLPIKANHLAYDEPWILDQFNGLVELYHDTDIRNPIALKQPLPMDAINNFQGIPYICNSGDYTNGYGNGRLVSGNSQIISDKGRLMMTFR